MLENMLLLDFSCSHLLYETIEEIRGFGLCLENLLENSVDDVVWCMRKALDSSVGLIYFILFLILLFKFLIKDKTRLRLFRGSMILDHNEHFIDNLIFSGQEYFHNNIGKPLPFLV